MKKIISTLLAMAMALTLFSLPVMAKPHATIDSDLMPVSETILNLEFNDSPNRYWGNYIGETTNFWNNSSVNSNAVSVAGGTITSGNYLNVTGQIYMQLKNSAGANSWEATAEAYDVETNPLRGSYVTEFKFMLPSLPTVAMKSFYTAHSNSGEGTSHGPKLWITTSGSLNAYTTDEGVSTAASLTAGTWYTIKIVNNIDSDSYDLYLNGVLVANDYGFCGGKFFAESFSRPFMITTEGNPVYIDDLKIYKEVTGRQNFAADDFSSYSADAAYNSTTELREFGGFALYPRNGYQSGVKIDAVNQRAEFSTGAMLFAGFAKTWNAPDNTLTDSLIGKKQVSVEFDFTPSSDTVGNFYQITDAVGAHYGLILAANEGKISAKIGREGDVTPSSADVGVDLASFTAGETYRIKVYADLDKTFTQNLTGNQNGLDGTYTRSGRADVYIDGKLVGSELPLRYNCRNANASSDITNLGRAFCISGETSATYYIDNIAIYTDVREKVLSTAFSTLNKRMAGQNINLPASTETGYTVTWSTESDAITIQNNVASVVCGATAQKATLVATVKDAANQLSVTGEVDVTIPAAYELDVKTANEGSTIESVTFRDNNASGKAVDIYTVIYTVEDKAIASCKTVKNAVSATVNPLNISVAEGATVKYFVWENGTLVPVTFTKTVTE